MVFSTRNGYKGSELQFETASYDLKRKIMTAFYKQEFDPIDLPLLPAGYTTGIEDMMVEMGISYKFPSNSIIKQKNADALRKYILESKEWYLIFDLIEKYLMLSDDATINEMEPLFNRILEEEVSGYRILDEKVIPITNKAELSTIQESYSTKYDSVNKHIRKALDLFSERKKPDYENSIKESICAVEAMCCIITGKKGKQATLSSAIKKLRDCGVHIHPAMESAFLSLYGYTSDKSGIRHGGIDFVDSPAEDAKYMLISCSAFVNYLIEKWSKIDYTE